MGDKSSFLVELPAAGPAVDASLAAVLVLLLAGPAFLRPPNRSPRVIGFAFVDAGFSLCAAAGCSGSVVPGVNVLLPSPFDCSLGFVSMLNRLARVLGAGFAGAMPGVSIMAASASVPLGRLPLSKLSMGCVAADCNVADCWASAV